MSAINLRRSNAHGIIEIKLVPCYYSAYRAYCALWETFPIIPIIVLVQLNGKPLLSLLLFSFKLMGPINGGLLIANGTINAIYGNEIKLIPCYY